MRLIEYFDRGADLYPDRHLPARRHTGLDLRGRAGAAHRVANGLLGRAWGALEGCGLQPQHAAAYACLLGIVRAGIPGRRSMRAMRRRRTSIFSATPTGIPVLSFELRASLPRIREACPRIRDFVCLDAPSFDTLARAPQGRGADLPRRSDAVAFLASSGGTTGRPRGADHQSQHRGHELDLLGLHAGHHDTGPSHGGADDPCGGRLLLPVAALWRHHIFMGTADPGGILAAIEKHRVTHIYMPPTLIYMLLAHPDVGKYDYSSLKHLVYASAPMSVDKLVEAIRVFGPA